MGQVLGFSHCKEFGSVSSTPDSTPPCTDGGNEESDIPELQTAREWSDDDDDDGGEDDDGGASSPSVWGTPRQHSFELTFSYIAFAEAEGSSRRDSAATGRRRGGSRGGRGSLSRVDTVETLLAPDSPTAEWDPHSFLTGEEEQGEGEEREEVRPQLLESHRRTAQLSTQDAEEEPQDREPAGRSREEEISGTQHRSLTDSHQGDSYQVLPHRGSVIMETAATLRTEEAPYPSSASIGRITQEELDSEQWFSALSLSEGTAICIRIAVMDLIYWKDTERTGVVFTGLVVGLLSLFQLSLITVVSTLSLAAMCFTISVCIYYKLLHVIQWSDGTHPFQSYLDMDIGLSGEQAQHYMRKAIVLICSAVDALKRLIFVGSLFNSLKLLLLMYLVTFMGHLCNGLTLLIVGVIALFSVPLFYRQHQGSVDGIFIAWQAKIDNFKDFLHRLAQGGGPSPDPTPGGAKPKTH